MNELERLIKDLIIEIQGLRADLKPTYVDTCTPQEAMVLIGLNNRGYLKYFVDQMHLTRRKGGSSFLYFKSECLILNQKIKNGEVTVPIVRSIYEKL